MSRIALSIMVLVLIGAPAAAQRPSPGEGPAHNEIVAPGITSVNWGVMGLNVGVSAGEDGILLIDDQENPAVPRLKAELTKISTKPVRLVINSHWHFDHVGGNEAFSKEGALVVAQTNTLARLMS